MELEAPLESSCERKVGVLLERKAEASLGSIRGSSKGVEVALGRRLDVVFLEGRLKVVLEAPLEKSAEAPLKLGAPLERQLEALEVPLERRLGVTVLPVWKQTKMEAPSGKGMMASQD